MRGDLQREKLAIKADNDNGKKDEIYYMKNGTDLSVRFAPLCKLLLVFWKKNCVKISLRIQKL